MYEVLIKPFTFQPKKTADGDIMNKRPNIIVILNDDMGYSDVGCYGGEMLTPNIDKMADEGVKFTRFYNSPRCSPTRASLLTGLHPHQCGIGILTEQLGPEAYEGNLNKKCITMAELLRENGYKTYLSGKWHLAEDFKNETDTWPKHRGFDEFYGIVGGAASYFVPSTLTRGTKNIVDEAWADKDYYFTDAISDNASDMIRKHAVENPEQPFFHYIAYTATHWPLHAKEKDIAKYKGRFDKGWDVLRQERLNRMVDIDIIDEKWALTQRDESQPCWEDAANKEWQARRMEVYAAQLTVMDEGIGRVLKALHDTGQKDNTIIMFMADNGGCAEELSLGWNKNLLENGIAEEYTRDGKKVQFGNDPDVIPGGEDTYQSYGIPWANLSNTPFRLYKHWTHEGGISSPFIVKWPEEIAAGQICRQNVQLTDVMATIVDITGVDYPNEYHGNDIPALEGESMLRLWKGEGFNREKPLFWEHEGNGALLEGSWKLVRKYPGDWELYDLIEDRTELNDISSENEIILNDMKQKYKEMEEHVGVIDREKILILMDKARSK